MTPHARPRRTLRLDGRYLGLGLMIVSAALTVGVIWFGLALLFSLAEYRVEQVLP